MKINLISDLHLDINNATILDYGFIKSLSDIDVLLIAGDTSGSFHNECNNLNMLEEYIETNGLKTKVLAIGGNHSFYDYDIEHITKTRGIQFLRERFNSFPVMYLENDFVQIDDIVFWGATFYTDLNLKHDIQSAVFYSRYLNDFRYVYKDVDTKYDNLEKIIQPCDYIKWNKESFEKLQEVVKKDFVKKIIVLTHHAPNGKSISEEYVNEDTNPLYASDFSEFILDNPKIKYWCHGHIHTPSDYYIGDTRILCNPHGYNNNKVKSYKGIIFDI